MLASLPRALRTARSFGCLARWVLPNRRMFSFGLELQLAAAGSSGGLGDFEGRVGAGVERVRPAAVDDAGGGRFAAVGPVEGEVVAVDVDEDRADVELGAAEHVRDVLGPGVDLRRLRIEEERHPDDDVAEVEGTGDRRGDDHDRDRCAFVAAGEVGVALDFERSRAGPGLHGGGADPALVRADRVFPLRRAGAVFGFLDRIGRAVGDALQLRGRPFGQDEVDPFQLLLSLRPADLDREGGEGLDRVGFRGRR